MSAGWRFIDEESTSSSFHRDRRTCNSSFQGGRSKGRSSSVIDTRWSHLNFQSEDDQNNDNKRNGSKIPSVASESFSHLSAIARERLASYFRSDKDYDYFDRRQQALKENRRRNVIQAKCEKLGTDSGPLARDLMNAGVNCQKVSVSPICTDSLHNTGLDGIIAGDIRTYNEPRPVTFSVCKYPLVDYVSNPPLDGSILT